MSEEPSEQTNIPPNPELISRRQFFNRLILALLAVGGVLMGIPFIGFLFEPLIRKFTPVWRPVGAVDKFPIGSTTDVSFVDANPLSWSGVTANSAAWLRRDSETQFTAFSVNCTHLGCPVRWVAGSQLFMCPCHGGVYNKNGEVVAGPPPLPLPRYPVRVNNGQVEIQASPVPITAPFSLP
ncbi:MAG: Rieske (2Fe-2S) protein [Chloroflexi bacterium]|nr:Rieske (2Fe-2S) protein [Chloroflexota bacterium]